LIFFHDAKISISIVLFKFFRFGISVQSPRQQSLALFPANRPMRLRYIFVDAAFEPRSVSWPFDEKNDHTVLATKQTFLKQKDTHRTQIGLVKLLIIRLNPETYSVQAALLDIQLNTIDRNHQN
jgi:hypothetical protein